MPARGRGAIPSALIREASVVGLISSISAAPPGPKTFPAQASSAARMFVRSWSRIGLLTCRAGRELGAGGIGQIDPQAAVLRQDRGALDHVLQFADIAGPVVAGEPPRIALRQTQIGLQRLAL